MRRKVVLEAAAVMTAWALLFQTPVFAAGRNGLQVKGTPQRNANTVTVKPSDQSGTAVGRHDASNGVRTNPVSAAEGQRKSLNYAEARETNELRVITKTPGGRNLLVPESNNTRNRVTIRKLPSSARIPGEVLSLPDSGKEIEELIAAPEGLTSTAADNRDINKKAARNAKENSITSARYPYVSLYGDVSDSDFNDFTQYMDRIIKERPDLVNEAVNNGWKVILTSYDLNELLFGGETEGVEGCTYFPTDDSDGVIYVHAGEYSYCVIHEFGHVLDCLCNFPSQSSEFKDIYDSEAGELTDYAGESPLEFFAETFMYSMLQPDTTLTACPRAYNFIYSCLDDITRGAA